MIRNYLKIGYRSILKHKQSSLINSIGLGIAFSTCLVLFTFLDRLYNMDKCHENSDRIFMVESVIENDGQERIFGNTPFALSTSAKADIPEVEDAIRMQYTSADFRFKDKVFNESVIFADDGFMEMFTFNLLSGTLDVLKENKIALSKSMALKYFGEEEALGKQVSMLFSMNGKEYKETFFVGAVADEFDYMSTIRFNALIPFESRRNLGFTDDGDWVNLTNATFILLQNSEQVQHVTNQLNAYTKIQNEANPDRKITHFLLDPLPKTALNAHGKEAMIVYNAPLFARILLTTIAVFILILAVFNYINISVVSATSRLKEIGLRKTIGGSRKQIIVQFIFENTLLCFLAFVFGYMLTVGFTLPGFNSILGVVSPLILDFGNPRLWIYITALFLLVSFGSAAYPAFFISAFRPVHIFKGDLKLTSKNYFTKSLLAVQLIISFITISLGVVFVLNNNYIEKRDWGYNKEQTIIVPLAYNDQYTELKDAFTQNPDIKIISGSQGHMGYWTAEDAVEYESEQYVSKKIMAGYEYLDVLGFRLKDGRFFENNSTTDLNESLVVNAAFVNKLELDDPIGARIILDDKAHYIIGVTEDFHFKHFGHRIEPLMFKVTDEKNFGYIAIRTAVGKAVVTEEFVQSTWKNMFPDNMYEGFF
ncbi:MAG: ABC transporter permease, partial [Cyclobacteriaceae bacterium]|nr:ABC transporter permease [Cyclobacteriaceae bacterium]